MEYLEFEQPIKDLMEQYSKCSIVGEDAGIDMKLACSQIEDKILEKRKKSTEILRLGKPFSCPDTQIDLIV